MSKLKDIDGLLNGRHFDREVIIVCMRWYLRYKLSFRDLAEIMAERGLSLVDSPDRFRPLATDDPCRPHPDACRLSQYGVRLERLR